MPNPYLFKLSDDPNFIEIHTSDRQTYKRCRRRYQWGATIRDNLVRTGLPENKNFFLGTGLHFALEDYWGWRRFDHPALAFAAYYDAQNADDVPDEGEEILDMTVGMLSYYVEDWLAQWPEPFETLWVPGQSGRDEPQCEVEVKIDITDMLLEQAEIDGGSEWLAEVLNGRRVVYVTTYDRVVIDEHERIYPVDYKSAAQFDALNLQTNPQAGAYDWSADLFYSPLGFKVEGMIWQQHKKAVPKVPKIVNVGKKNEGISTDIRQHTTYRMYLREVKRYHKGAVPPQYSEIIGSLANSQDDNGDAFIRRDILRRNTHQREIEQENLIAEVLEMLDPGLPLYPNFTKDCGWDCPFKAPCMAKNDGMDFEHMLATEYTQWQGYKDDWRKRVKYPEAVAS